MLASTSGKRSPSPMTIQRASVDRFDEVWEKRYAMPGPESADEAHGRLVRQVSSGPPLRCGPRPVRSELIDVDPVGIDEHACRRGPG